jgi:hypothetical protein
LSFDVSFMATIDEVSAGVDELRVTAHARKCGDFKRLREKKRLKEEAKLKKEATKAAHSAARKVADSAKKASSDRKKEAIKKAKDAATGTRNAEKKRLDEVKKRIRSKEQEEKNRVEKAKKVASDMKKKAIQKAKNAAKAKSDAERQRLDAIKRLVRKKENDEKNRVNAAQRAAHDAAKKAKNRAKKLKDDQAKKERERLKKEDAAKKKAEEAKKKKRGLEDTSGRDLEEEEEEDISLATDAKDTETSPVACKIAYGYHSSKVSSSFEDLGFDGEEYEDDDISWGWTSGPLASSAYLYSLEMYSARKDGKSGSLVGSLTVGYDGEEAAVTIDAGERLWLKDVHAYVGTSPLPVDENGTKTVDPLYYPVEHTRMSLSRTFSVEGLGGDPIYVIAEATVCGFFPEEEEYAADAEEYTWVNNLVDAVTKFFRSFF